MYCTSLDRYNLKTLLETNFKGIDYSDKLLHNVVQSQKAKKERFKSLKRLTWLCIDTIDTRKEMISNNNNNEKKKTNKNTALQTKERKNRVK